MSVRPLMAFLAGIAAGVACSLHEGGKIAATLRKESKRRQADRLPVDLDSPIPYRPAYTCDQWDDCDEPTPSEVLHPDVELCYGFSTTPKGAPCS